MVAFIFIIDFMLGFVFKIVSCKINRMSRKTKMYKKIFWLCLRTPINNALKKTLTDTSHNWRNAEP